MEKTVRKNRWGIAVSAVAIHLSIGSAYAYSVFKHPLEEKLGWSGTQVAFAFTIAIFFLGMSAAVFGRFVEKLGPRKSAFAAAVLFAAGLAGAGWAVDVGSLALFYATYGVVSGIGLGIGYLAPVSTLMAWFPDRKGLATGLAVMGFGAGALICSPVAVKLIDLVGLSQTYLVLAGVYFLLIVCGSVYLEKPPAGWTPGGSKTTAASSKAAHSRGFEPAPLTPGQAVRTKRFWLLWAMMFVNISAGITLISVASPMAQEKVGLTAVSAAAMVGVMGLFNGGGRIGWGTLSDYIGRGNVFLVFFAAQVVLFLLMPSITNPVLFQAFIFIILTFYGGGFASLSAFVSDLFGMKHLSEINGYLLTAWSFAGAAGPMAAAAIRDSTQSYDAVFYSFAGPIAAALVLSLMMKREIRRMRSAESAAPDNQRQTAVQQA
ncbi:L-lactate MFS transporter [Paenibacillus turpanensis]|uniref:L-lactate MFS transporter n=1 Tax=Paenibacillus turpanensis TaxID=2689078 RepID=UPI00140E7E74